MRKHGWQLPYHPLQVVAIAVFAALGFAFYVFFLPFVGSQTSQYVAMGLYTPLITCVVTLYIWCAATNPGDPGICRSTRHSRLDKDGRQSHSHSHMDSGHGLHAADNSEKLSSMLERKDSPSWLRCSQVLCLVCLPFSCLCKGCLHPDDQHSEENMSEEGMFFCSLCEAEVLKNSKHCRVCDKCVDGFDHHCRWLNNCIGKRNYKGFFILMSSAVLLLVVQWLSGTLVIILCIVKRGDFSRQIDSKLGSSFSTVAFVIVVATCTILAMIATVPLAQLLCFHILLIKKGISTYDYIIALREQEEDQQEEVAGHQSPQMSIISSVTGFSTASSFGPLHRGSWCTPPRLFLEDQFDVIPPEIGMSQNPGSKKMKVLEGARRRNGTVKISPWTLARLNAEEVSKAAAQAKKKSKILKPIARQDPPIIHDNRRGRFPAELSLDPLARLSASGTESNFSDGAMEASASLAPLQLEARSAFQPSTAASSRIAVSSPESSFDSPDLHPFRVSSCTADEMLGGTPHAAQSHIEFTRSTSDGYEASGGEDSDRIPSRIVHRSSNWANSLLHSGQAGPTTDQHMPSSEGFLNNSRSS
ncbi:probable protein S-acyltransferase 22 [Hordeum vulgare subsp. vulgare]|uniref:S-acyltransferase n=1 Tax=Hordeum vulgare subsp. vulgare TaxID=112509 RepID=A0A8I7B7I3_HORVV|nr:probable protein S-acyltransferase 22 [Hordeum vulgare subsp. vulgare]